MVGAQVTADGSVFQLSVKHHVVFHVAVLPEILFFIETGSDSNEQTSHVTSVEQTGSVL